MNITNLISKVDKEKKCKNIEKTMLIFRKIKKNPMKKLFHIPNHM